MKKLNEKNEDKLISSYGLYRRVSADKQVEEGESLETQLSLANQYISKLDKSVELFDYCEKGVSGSKVHFTKRPELMRMLDDANKGLFSTLLVFRRDRLDRTDEFHTIKYILIKAKVKIVYLDPNEINISEDNIYGPLIESIITSIAAIEPKLISIRVKAVLREKALNGFWRTGKPPYGLFHDKDNSKLIPIEEEAKIVKKIFYYYTQEKLGYRKIALMLNEDKILFRNNQGVQKQWSTHNIKTIINNPIYKGYIKFIDENNKIQLIPCSGMDSLIIPPETFDKANKIRESRGNLTITPRKFTTTFLLSNIFFCSCGSPMRGIDSSYYYTNKNGVKEHKKYIYYSCALYQEGKHQGKCGVKMINAVLVHQLILDYCREKFLPSNYKETHNELIERQHKAVDETKFKLKHYARRISELKRKTDVLFEHLESTTQPHLVSTYEHNLSLRLKELEKYQEEYLQQKKEYKQIKERVWSIEEISENLKDWRKNIYKVPPEKQRKMILSVVNKVQLDKSGELIIELKLDLESFQFRKMERGAHNNSYVHLFPLFNNIS